MIEEKKPALPSEISKEKLPYYMTSSETTSHLASEVVSREGVKPIRYKWEDLNDELKNLVTKVWKLESLTSEQQDKLPYEDYARYLFDPRKRFSKPEALDGLRVLEVCSPRWSNFGAQFCGSLLAEHGAEVIKIEDPARGDAMRWVGPPVDEGGAMKTEGENWPPHGTSLAGFCENRNKYCLSIDIATEKGREMLKDLVRISGVLIENYEPGHMDSLGIGYRQLRRINPCLVYCAVTGYGQWGDESWRKTFETGIQAMSTLSSFTGEIDYEAETYEEAIKDSVPTHVGWPIGHVSGGILAAVGILGALLYRERKSGKGQFIDVSSEGLIMWSCDVSFSWYSTTGRVRGPWGNWDFTINPYGLHPCKEGRYSIVAGMGPVYPRVCDTIGTKEAQRMKVEYPDNTARILWRQQKLINAEITKWTKQHTMDELNQMALKGDFAASGVFTTKEIYEHPHFLDRAVVMEVDDPLYGKVLIQGTMPNFSETPGRIKWISRPLGWDNETLLRKYLGLSQQKLWALELEGVIGKRGGSRLKRRPATKEAKIERVRDFNELSEDIKALILKARKGIELTPEEEDALPYDEFCRYTFGRERVWKKPKPLDGLRLIDWTTVIFGPSASAMLAEMGMEVIKIEIPGFGDTMRYTSPPIDQGGCIKWTEEASGTKAEGILGERVTEEVCPPLGTALAYMDPARNKLHLSLDIHPGPGAEILKKLASKADVLIQNVRGGTMNRWGIGWRQLSKINPRLIFAALNGPGQWGREDLVRASYDILAQSNGGSAYITGHPNGEQLKVPIWVDDYFGGEMAVIGVLIALLWRKQSGRGQFIETSQTEFQVRALGPGITWYGKTGIIQERYGNRNRWVCPDGIVRAKDGFIAIGADDEAFIKLCECIGGKATELPAKYPTNVDRVSEAAQDEIYRTIEDWSSNLTVAEIEALGKRYGFGTCPIKDAKDACTQKHYLERGEIEEIDDPWYGRMKIQGCFPLYSATPARIEFIAKPMGWDTEYVLRRFVGLSSERIKELERKHIVGKVAGAEGRRERWRK